MTVMVQSEVAARMTAAPGTPDYGALTAAISLRGSARQTRKVGRQMFSPPPNVDSAVVRIDLAPPREGLDYAAVSKVIRAAFAMRRKTLVNNLTLIGLSRERAAAAVEACGLGVNVRGETLNANDFCKLTQTLNAQRSVHNAQ